MFLGDLYFNKNMLKESRYYKFGICYSDLLLIPINRFWIQNGSHENGLALKVVTAAATVLPHFVTHKYVTKVH